MQGFAIVKFEADAQASQDGILGQFNQYLQQRQNTTTFVRQQEGYFRLTYSSTPSSAGIEAFGDFLQTSGFAISGISTAMNNEGADGTSVCFEKEGKQQCVIVSTISEYK